MAKVNLNILYWRLKVIQFTRKVLKKYCAINWCTEVSSSHHISLD